MQKNELETQVILFRKFKEHNTIMDFEQKIFCTTCYKTKDDDKIDGFHSAMHVCMALFYCFF